MSATPTSHNSLHMLYHFFHHHALHSSGCHGTFLIIIINLLPTNCNQEEPQFCVQLLHIATANSFTGNSCSHHNTDQQNSKLPSFCLHNHTSARDDSLMASTCQIKFKIMYTCLHNLLQYKEALLWSISKTKYTHAQLHLHINFCYHIRTWPQ